MADLFSNYLKSLNAPASAGAAAVPSDTVDLTTFSRRVWVGGAGNLKVDLVEGGTVTLSAVPAGTMIDIRVSRVYVTGTNATLVIILW